MDEQIRFVETVKSSLEEYMTQDDAKEIKVTSIVKESERKMAERTVRYPAAYTNEFQTDQEKLNTNVLDRRGEAETSARGRKKANRGHCSIS